MIRDYGDNDLFADEAAEAVDRPAVLANAPLAERLRPTSFEEMVGQRKLLGPNGVVERLLAEGRPPSLVLWGPPGCGKTTVARIIGTRLGLSPVGISAVTSGVKDVKDIVKSARARIDRGGEPTLLFVDEIHRFNKAQQDAFLGPVEDGTIVLLGATTENPSFELNNALLSRARVITLEPLDREDLRRLLERALTEEKGLLSRQLELAPDLIESLLDAADGDARALLTDLEWVAAGVEPGRVVSADEAREILSRLPRHDKSGEDHFNIISALHKSLRGSDVQAGLYWLARMIEGGDDPLYVARRLVRFASEDIGAADPQALVIANAARDAVHFLGLPEGALALAEAVVYLGSAPKSDRVYRAFNAAVEEVRSSGSLPVPHEIRNAPTNLMKELGYGAGYRSAHESTDGLRVPFLPESLRGTRFYEPAEIGFEREIAKRMAYFERLKQDDDER